MAHVAGVGAPAAWVCLFTLCIRAPETSLLRVVGPAAHLVVAAALRLVGTVAMLSAFRFGAIAQPVHAWESAQSRTRRLRQLLDPNAPAGFARAQRTLASVAQSSGLQHVPRAPPPRQKGTGIVPENAANLRRPWERPVDDRQSDDSEAESE